MRQAAAATADRAMRPKDSGGQGQRASGGAKAHAAFGQKQNGRRAFELPTNGRTTSATNTGVGGAFTVAAAGAGAAAAGMVVEEA